MSKARLVITAVIVEGRSQAQVARDYGLSKAWVSRLVARYHADGDNAFQPRSRRPHTSPGATSADHTHEPTSSCSSTTSTSASSTPPQAKSCAHSPSTRARTTKEQADQSADHQDPTDHRKTNGPNPKTQVQTVAYVALDDIERTTRFELATLTLAR